MRVVNDKLGGAQSAKTTVRTCGSPESRVIEAGRDFSESLD